MRTAWDWAKEFCEKGKWPDAIGLTEFVARIQTEAREDALKDAAVWHINRSAEFENRGEYARAADHDFYTDAILALIDKVP